MHSRPGWRWGALSQRKQEASQHELMPNLTLFPPQKHAEPAPVPGQRTPDPHVGQLVQQLMREHKWVEARDRLEDALALSPEDFWLERTLADVCIRMGDTQRAAPHLQRLLSSHPSHPRVLLLAAERHRLEGRWDEATPLYLESLQLQQDAYVRSRAVDGLMGLERFAEAEALVEEGLRLSPQDDWLLRKKARILSATGRRQEASQLYVLASSTTRGANPRDYVEGLKLKLEALAPAERLNEVSALLKVGSHRDNPWLHLLAAELNLDLNRAEAARLALDRARQLHDEPSLEGVSGHRSQPAANHPDFSLLKSMGYLYNRLEAYPEVISTLGRAFVHDPRDLPVQQVLLKAGRLAQQLPEVRTLFVLAYEQHPGFHKLNGLIKKIDHLIENR